ncbi:taurine catabolism dioxygenase TauD [Anopheles sinensis]|uniref:Taurine catabolism dioxygenase TauD n=1 Tax=Anopheles sinensis TaxID=74873 RepID=A0A084WNN5_ANOSI|nr:taurine catabolism dioxygenase TauD [Anopheles sinensis]
MRHTTYGALWTVDRFLLATAADMSLSHANLPNHATAVSSGLQKIKTRPRTRRKVAHDAEQSYSSPRAGFGLRLGLGLLDEGPKGGGSVFREALDNPRQNGSQKPASSVGLFCCYVPWFVSVSAAAVIPGTNRGTQCAKATRTKPGRHSTPVHTRRRYGPCEEY